MVDISFITRAIPCDQDDWNAFVLLVDIFGFVHHTALYKYVSKYGIAVYVVVENRLDNGTFFDNHYTNKQDTWDRDNRVR